MIWLLWPTSFAFLRTFMISHSFRRNFHVCDRISPPHPILIKILCRNRQTFPRIFVILSPSNVHPLRNSPIGGVMSSIPARSAAGRMSSPFGGQFSCKRLIDRTMMYVSSGIWPFHTYSLITVTASVWGKEGRSDCFFLQHFNDLWNHSPGVGTDFIIRCALVRKGGEAECHEHHFAIHAAMRIILRGYSTS